MGLLESSQAPVVVIQIFIKGEEKSLDLFTFHFVRDFFCLFVRTIKGRSSIGS